MIQFRSFNQACIRSALPEEARALTALTRVSKGYWGYSEAQMRVWEPELTVSAEYIQQNTVLVAEENGALLGYASILCGQNLPPIQIGGTAYCRENILDNLFVHPDVIRRGVGSSLFRAITHWCSTHGILSFCIVADPNARRFYERMGAVYVGDTQALATARALPFLIYSVPAKGKDTTLR